MVGSNNTLSVCLVAIMLVVPSGNRGEESWEGVIGVLRVVAWQVLHSAHQLGRHHPLHQAPRQER
jgi:hypothetical protein